MKYSLLFFILVAYFICYGSAEVQANIYNPKPSEDDLILPMPDGAQIVFRPVFIGVGDEPFALKEFKMGDRRTGGFKEYPTKVVISGAFIKTNPKNDQKDWVYYIGKYEVTEAQYLSIMDSDKKSESQNPVINISWFDVQEFIKKYNLWLFEHAENNLPKHEDSFGFLRLPTEIEWEFAARGGNEVDATQFDKQHPYPGILSKYEWFGGPSSSHGKLKKTGLLKPNPLKIHDMLGNVSEMTNSLYQIEYYQGRTGGCVARGGNYISSEDRLRSSERNEIPFYKSIKGKIVPTRQPILGFRLVISSQILASKNTSQELESAWDDYLKTRPTPVARPMNRLLPQAEQTDIQLADAIESMNRLVVEINKTSNVSQTVYDQLGLLNASFQNIESTIKKHEVDSAYAWVKVASVTAYYIYMREIDKLPAKYKSLKLAQDLGRADFVEKIQKQIDDKEKNIKDGLETYGLTFEQLVKINATSVNKGFEKYKNELKNLGPEAANQVKMTELVNKHYQEYLKYRRRNPEKWRADLESF